ncbi:thioesterase family protein [Aliiglaciecola litoralis]|uniref:Thioesterase family protein n=1 Tax=Aliiglaciecola litoralis TaxID=582857 RepID=A0ABP3WZY5_9ALTE
MTVDQLLSQARNHSENPLEVPHLLITKEWAQGRTAFGGVSAAMVYAAIKQQVSNDRVMRSFNCNFVGPLQVDSPFTIEIDILRQGKNVTQVIAKAIQNQQVALLCQSCFGVGRESKIVVENDDNHQMTIPKKAKFIPQIPKITPKFLRHFDLSIVEGALPFTGSKIDKIDGWMRFKQPPAQMQDAHLIALIDAWPPTVLQLLKWPAPASTMSWNVEFLHPHQQWQPSDWFAYAARTRQAGEGYAHTEANIWDQQGKLVALSRQTVGIFD